MLGGSVNATVATLSAAVDSPLDNNIYPGWKGRINGPNHGILNMLETPNNWDYFRDAALITLFYKGSSLKPEDLGEFIESGHTVASFGSPQIASVPEPATVLLLAVGLAGLVGMRRRRP